MDQHHFKVFVTITYALPSTTGSPCPSATGDIPPCRTTIRRFSAEASTTLEAFKALLEETVVGRPEEATCVLSIAYKDSDGDTVEVTNEMEWREAVAIAPSSNSTIRTIPLLVEARITQSLVCVGAPSQPLTTEACVKTPSSAAQSTPPSVGDVMGADEHMASRESREASTDGFFSSDNVDIDNVDADDDGAKDTQVVCDATREDSTVVRSLETAVDDSTEGTKATLAEGELDATSRNTNANVTQAEEEENRAREVEEKEESTDYFSEADWEVVLATPTDGEAETKNVITELAVTDANEGEKIEPAEIEADNIPSSSSSSSVSSREAILPADEKEDEEEKAPSTPTQQVAQQEEFPAAEDGKGHTPHKEEAATKQDVNEDKDNNNNNNNDEERRCARLTQLFFPNHPARIIVKDVKRPTSQPPRVTVYPNFSNNDEPSLRLLSLLHDCKDIDIELLDPLRRVNFGASLRRTVDPFVPQTCASAAATVSEMSSANLCTDANGSLVGGEGSSFILELYWEQIRRHVSSEIARLLGRALSKARRIRSTMLTTPPASSASSPSHSQHNGRGEASFLDLDHGRSSAVSSESVATSSDEDVADVCRAVEILTLAVEIFAGDATLWYHLACAVAARQWIAAGHDHHQADESGGEGESSSPHTSAVRAALYEALHAGYGDMEQLLGEPLFAGMVTNDPQLCELAEGQVAEAFLKEIRPATDEGVRSSSSFFPIIASSISSESIEKAKARANYVMRLMSICPSLTSVAKASALLDRFGNNVHAAAGFLIDE